MSVSRVLRQPGNTAHRSAIPAPETVNCYGTIPAMNVLESVKDRIRGRGLRVVFPEADDERIVAAARRLREERLAVPVMLSEALEDGKGSGLDP